MGLGLALRSGRPLVSLGLHVPAAAGALVWVPHILGGAENQVPPARGGLVGRPADRLWRLRRGSTLGHPGPGHLLVVALLWRGAGPALAAGTLGLLGGTALFGARHMFTPHAAVFGLVLLPLGLAALAGSLRERRWLRRVAGLVAAGWLAQVVGEQAVHGLDEVTTPTGRDASAAFVRAWPELSAEVAGVAIVPDYAMQPLLLEAAGELLGQQPRVGRL